MKLITESPNLAWGEQGGDSACSKSEGVTGSTEVIFQPSYCLAARVPGNGIFNEHFFSSAGDFDVVGNLFSSQV